jgi:RsiW-degrading membrane proteinase PrsW (M82 family)
MTQPRDPVEARADDDTDLYEVSTWEVRSVLDHIVASAYSLAISGARLFLVLLGLVLLVAQVVLGALYDEVVLVFTLLSVVPALLLAAYLWYADVTTNEPLYLIAATFVLGILFAGFAGVVNSLITFGLESVGLAAGIVGFVAQVVFFFVVVGPVEESVKLLAVRLYAFRSRRFDAVIDGAVYGAVAGLGFATIENAIYISGQIEGISDPLNLAATGGAIAVVRALAGPGHVIYSAFAGYYLGLAKFNPDRAGPIVVKGLLIAALIHAVYNSLSGVVLFLASEFLGVPWILAFFGFVIVYVGLFGLVLLRKLGRYRRAYNAAHDDGPDGGPTADLTEFDG